MNRKLALVFLVSALTGSLILGFLFMAEYMTGPELVLHNVTVQLNEEVTPWTFVTSCPDKDAVVSYVNKPDVSVPGGQEIKIKATGKNGKETVRTATLKVSILKHNLKLEATGEPMQLKDILVSEIDPSEVSFKYKPVVLNHVTTVDAKVIYQNVEYQESIMVVDTQKPDVTLKAQLVTYLNHDFDVSTLVAGYADATEVTPGYKGILDTKTEGEYPITLVFKDEGDNVTEIVANLSVIADAVPPQIQGAADKEYFLGENISYMDGVTAEDAVDGACEVSVDNSGVDPEKEGTYPVLYTAKDLSGNEASLTVQYTIRKMTATEEKLNQKADEVLAEITNDSMTISRKAYEIYNYAYSTIAYTGTSDKSDWENEAYRGLNEHNGDCFTYMSVCKILLERCGIQTMIVQRIGGEAEHYWLLVNTGTGWYHFDATRRSVYFDGFMARDEDVAAYTEQVGNHYYTFDTAKYPATPTEKYQVE